MNLRDDTDLLYGMSAIASHIGLTERQALHLKETSEIPTFKMGRRVCALRSKLDEWLRAKSEGSVVE